MIQHAIGIPVSLSGLEESFSVHRATFETLNRAWIKLIQRHARSLISNPRFGLSGEQIERIAAIGPVELDRLVKLDFPLPAHRSRTGASSWSKVDASERHEWRHYAGQVFVALGGILRQHGNSARLLLGASCGCENALGLNPLTSLDEQSEAESRLFSRLSANALTYLLEGVDGTDDLWVSARRQAHVAIHAPIKCDCVRKN